MTMKVLDGVIKNKDALTGGPWLEILKANDRTDEKSRITIQNVQEEYVEDCETVFMDGICTSI